MSTITEFFKQAELALAAYSSLAPGISGKPYTDALEDVGMTPTQATTFAATWNVVTQYTDPITGVSATVFQAVAGGPKYLAIRGTQGLTDYLADYLILNGTPSTLNPQYQALKTQVQSWLGDGTLTSGFTVAGHSLGGYLAAGLVADFGGSISQAYLYNAPGNNSLVSEIAQALGFSSAPDASKITSLRADAGISPIAALGNDFSTPIPIHIENQFLSDISDPPGSLNHSQRVLTDSLALYAMFARIDPAASVESISKIIKASSAQNGNTLELTLDALRTLFQQNYPYGQLDYDAVPTMVGSDAISRDAYYTNLQSLQTWLDNSPFIALSIEPLAALGSSQIASRAMADSADGQAYRYALYKLNPFVVTGSTALYDGINAHGELNRYNPATGSGALTDQYLKDRAAMLTWKLKFGTNDTQLVGDTFVQLQGGTPFYFEDFTSNAITTKMRIGGGDSINAVMSRPLGDFNLIVFGSENNDLLTGQGKGDRLYGNAGADTLTGNGGDDYLEGGAGNDTYLFTPGDGDDIVLDTDGLGVIHFGAIAAQGSASVADGKDWIRVGNSWTDRQNGLAYLLINQADGTQALRISSGSGSVTVKDWSAGELGIELGANTPVPPPVTDLTLVGDLQPIDFDPAAAGVQTETDELGNVIVSGEAAPGRADALYGGAGNDHILSLGGDDYADGRGGQDHIEGGAGQDLLQGGAPGQSFTQVQIALDSGGALRVDDPFAATGTTTLEFANGESFDLETLIGERLFILLNLNLGGSGGRAYGGAGNDTLTTRLANESTWKEAA